VFFAVLGIGLLAGGGYVVGIGTDSLDTCGSSRLVASTVTEPSGDVVQFESLTQPQQELVHRTVDREPQAVTGYEWPWFESSVVVQYRGTHYQLYTVTTPCPFPPEAYIFGGVVGVLAGLGVLVPSVRRFVHSRHAD
jgi:hypothetical protein